MYTQNAEKSVAQAASGSDHSVRAAINRIKNLIDHSEESKAPPLGELLLLDALLAKLQVILDEEMVQAGESTSDK